VTEEGLIIYHIENNCWNYLLEALQEITTRRRGNGNKIILQRHIDFKSFRLGDSLLSVRDIRNMVMMSVVTDNFYGSFQSQRIQ